MAGECRHLIGGQAGLLSAFGLKLALCRNDATVNERQQQWGSGAQSAGVTFDIVLVKAAVLELIELELCQLLFVLAALLKSLLLGLDKRLFLLGQDLLLALLGLGCFLNLCLDAGLSGLDLGACFAASLLNLLHDAHKFFLYLIVWVQLYLAVLLSSPVVKDVLGAADLVGCRYRLVQRRAHPEIQPTEASKARAERHVAAVEAAMANLPVKAPGRFRRIDLEGDEWERSMATLEALAYGYTHITGAIFATGEWKVEIDLLLREGEAYTPIIVSNHRVARRNENARTLAVPTHRVGLSEPLEVPYKLRHHSVDGYRLAFAARALEDLDLNSGRGGAIGQDRSRVFFTDTARFDVASALAQPLPTGPRRVKECATCRFWKLCEPELRARDDISLFLPGDRAKPYREKGIETVQALIDAQLGEPSQLAKAWRVGEPLLRRDKATQSAQPGLTVPRADVEVDVDMEAYLDQGAYLWGAWYEGEYHAFVTWEPLGGRAEAANFAEFWEWLMGLRAQAHAAGKTFAAYCYSAHGENHWMRMSAKRFGAPQLEEVEEFIASPEWVDMFVQVKRNFVGPYGLGLKTVAPVAGFQWPEDFDGEESVNARREALAGDMEVRQQILDYNSGDVQATRAVRDFMSAGAPGVPALISF